MQENEICDICYAEYKGRTVSGFIRYFLAKVNEKYENNSYKTYITDILKSLAEHNNIQVSDRWCDLAFGTVENQEESINQAKEEFYNFFGGGDGV